MYKMNESTPPENGSQKQGSSFGTEEEEKEHSIEQILNKRTINGKNEYYIKWHTWVPKENLDCKEMIRQFEEKAKLEEEKKKKPWKRLWPGHKRDTTPKYKNERPVKLAKIIPKEPEKIIDVTFLRGKQMFSVKWKDCEESSLVPEKVANLLWPQMVIEFYETRITWIPENENGN